ncbi:MAG: cyclodeaminase/cyclohydrolase family protein [Candidatus Izemoplasmatales bacterium]
MKLIDYTVADFLTELSSDSPAPGGGSVSALAACNGCGLMIMVSKLSVEKKKFKTLDLKIQKSYVDGINQINIYLSEFKKLIDLDTEALNILMKAFKLPKNTDEEIEKRKEAIYKSTILCMDVPKKVLENSVKSLRIIENMIEYSNKNTLSDQGVAILMLYSAAEGAAMNVLINLPGIDSKDLKNQYLELVNNFIEEASKIKEKSLDKIKKLLY